jgi:hypothetical protein
MTFTFGLLVTASGRAFRVRQMREVIDGWPRACSRTSPPMKPVAPVSMTFIFARCASKLENGASITGQFSDSEVFKH